MFCSYESTWRRLKNFAVVDFNLREKVKVFVGIFGFSSKMREEKRNGYTKGRKVTHRGKLEKILETWWRKKEQTMMEDLHKTKDDGRFSSNKLHTSHDTTTTSHTIRYTQLYHLFFFNYIKILVLG